MLGKMWGAAEGCKEGSCEVMSIMPKFRGIRLSGASGSQGRSKIQVEELGEIKK